MLNFAPKQPLQAKYAIVVQPKLQKAKTTSLNDAKAGAFSKGKKRLNLPKRTSAKLSPNGHNSSLQLTGSFHVGTDEDVIIHVRSVDRKRLSECVALTLQVLLDIGSATAEPDAWARDSLVQPFQGYGVGVTLHAPDSDLGSQHGVKLDRVANQADETTRPCWIKPIKHWI